ncbi:Oligosaccharide translocation protein RFT1 [Cyphellophora attinorum]|uniref:Man(5)GlcNAc(2)-PP-dolichol translocation protein RFT1 n=1 Tax=Cyphellophora attinorum TaxID=1664694 RepID=A0A0N0NMA8_9EURO|nr:Oligosaccharide translocation protein RFT1 [Phialophora attinorum]KPI40138.1 Oligosaccharide translocation protein RFT1 [Phialophora attinorum]
MSGGTALLILTQLVSRGCTFIGNRLVLNYSSPTLLGIAVQLELRSITTLYFARESLRVALQRQPQVAISDTSADTISTSNKSGDRFNQLQGAINTSYLVVVLGLAVGSILFSQYLARASDEVVLSPSFPTVHLLYAIATVAELSSEPAFVVIQQQGLYGARATAESSAAVAKVLVALGMAVFEHSRGSSPSALPYAAGQLAYGLTIAVLYWRAAGKASRPTEASLLPGGLHTQSAQKNTRCLDWTLYFQSTFKQGLTTGDQWLLDSVAPLADQGAFAIASNYSGLLARLVFQPIEESSRNVFGQLLNTPGDATSDVNTSEHQETLAAGRIAETTTSSPSKIARVLRHLSLILHTYTLVSLPILVFGPPLLPALVPLALPREFRNDSTTTLFQSYVFYLPLMAVNGVIDAFVTSVATPAQLWWQSVGMIGFTGLYGAAAWLFLSIWGTGPEGLVWTQTVVMLARVAWGVAFVSSWIERTRQIRQKPLVSGLDKHASANGLSDRPGSNTEHELDDDWSGVSQRSLSLTTAAAIKRQTAESYPNRNLPTPTTFWPTTFPSMSIILASGAIFSILRTNLYKSTPPIDRASPSIIIPKYQLDPRLDLSLPGTLRQMGYFALAALCMAVAILYEEGAFLGELAGEVLPQNLQRKLWGMVGEDWKNYLLGLSSGRDGKQGTGENEGKKYL